MPPRTRLFAWLVLSSVMALLATAARATAQPAQLEQDSAAKAQVLRIAVTSLPPYAVLGPDGRWSGIGVDLFAATARDIGVGVEFVDVPIPLILRRIDKGVLDGTALPVPDTDSTPGIVALTADWGTAELHIATVATDDLAEPIQLLRSLLGPRQLKVYLALAVVAAFFGGTIWYLERNHNSAFEGRAGLSGGLWWSAVTLCTVGYGDIVPRTRFGRITAVVYMIASLILVALFTATVTSALTASDSATRVTGAHDLPLARVGTVQHGTADAYFAQHFLPHVSYPSLINAIERLAAGQLDAVVADQAALASAIKDFEQGVPQGELGQSIRMLPTPIDRRGIAFGLRRSLPNDLVQRFDNALEKRVSQAAAASATPSEQPR